MSLNLGAYKLGAGGGGGGIPTTGTPFNIIQYDALGAAQDVVKVTDTSGDDSLNFDTRELTDTNASTVLDWRDGVRLFDLRAATLRRTITPAGTTGNQTINKIAGTVNIAAGGSSVVVTNSLVDANSIILVVLRSSDTTATFKSVVAAAGSFTIRIVACTAEVSLGFIVTN